MWVYGSIPVRRFFCGKPVILVQDGKLVARNMQKTRVNADELTEYLRLQGYVDITQVRYAILETNGNISILPYARFAPACAKDAGIKVEETELPITLISHGTLIRENLAASGRTRAWVEQTLQSYNCRVRDVLLLTAERSGKLYLAIRKEAAS